MRWISEERLISERDSTIYVNVRDNLNKLIAECQELQEPWMTLDEFLKSGFQGWCWLCFKEGTVIIAYRDFDDFYADDCRVEVFRSKNITHVMPIRKPEPPR